VHAFGDEVLEVTTDNISKEHYVFYDQISRNDAIKGVFEGPVNLKKIPALEIEAETQFYICGPAGFIKKQYHDLMEIGVNPSTVFFEEFGPQTLSLN
jgi:nitric oxide dioxygenase